MHEPRSRTHRAGPAAPLLAAVLLSGTLLVGVLLASCAALPVKVALQDVTVDLGVITNTQGYVLYPATASVFQRSSLHVASATVDGDVRAEGLVNATDFTFFGRATDPATDPDCTPVTNLTGTYFACPAGNETSVSGAVRLPADGTPKRLHLSGGVLATAANRGRVWLGATVAGGTSTSATLDFTNLVASVVLL